MSRSYASSGRRPCLGDRADGRELLPRKIPCSAVALADVFAEFRFPRLFSVGLVEELSQTREPREHSALDRSERNSQSFRELRLREATVVGELERLPLHV